MLIHDRFVFLHIPKTGGRFIREALSRELPNCHPVADQRSHGGWDKIPAEASGRPVLAFVRNPWDWYVSWYSFVASRPPEWRKEAWLTNALVSRLFLHLASSENGTDDTAQCRVNNFPTTVRHACAGVVDEEDRSNLERVEEAFPLAGPLLEGHDFYSARLLASLGDGLHSDLLTLGRFESMVDDLQSFLRTVDVELPEGAWKRIRAMEPVGASVRGPYRNYYDAELRDLVASSCADLIERFGYRFDNAPEPLSGFHVVRSGPCEEAVSGDRPRIVHRGAGQRGEIALTFDDGPSDWTAAVARIFEEHECRATFFTRGEAIEALPGTVAGLAVAGHEIGNHLWSHSDASTQTRAELRAEIEHTADAIEQAGAPRPVLVRPPYFSAPRAVAEAAAGTHASMVVLRSIGSSDWEADRAEQIVGPVLAHAQAGDIVCLHDGISSDKRDSDSREPTVAAVKQLVPALLNRGLRPVTVSELLR
jgi:peptidoglycan/xylan/chitin deacetylase (PgdA/CDA1 family)